MMIALAAGLTFLLSLLLPFSVRPLLFHFGIVDVPNARSSHQRPVLRGLGLAVLGAMVIGFLLMLLLPAFANAGNGLMLALVALAALCAGLLGLSEDVRGVSVRTRSVLLVVLGAGVGLVLVWFAMPSWWLALLLVPYAVLFVSGYINVANFMDGLNGVSGLHGVISGLAFAAAGQFAALPWLTGAGLILAAAFAGFLPWNLSKPGAFLGDVGSYLLGGSTATISLSALLSGVPFLATIGPMVICFGDVAVTLVKRVRAGKQWDEPHKEHVYQQLQQRGCSHLTASSITACCTLATSLLGLASFVVDPVWWPVLFLAGLTVLLWYLRLPKLISVARPDE